MGISAKSVPNSAPIAGCPQTYPQLDGSSRLCCGLSIGERHVRLTQVGCGLT
ncbi:hypothetical protein ACFPRL_16280 [Pseudoclavibacter helvolus]